MKLYSKILLGTFFAIILLFIAANIYVSYYLDDKIEKEIQTRFSEATENEYRLKIGDTSLNIISRELSFQEIELASKKGNIPGSFRFNLESFNVSGIGFLDYLLNNDLSIEHIQLIRPDVTIVSPDRSPEQSDSTNTEGLSARLSSRVLEDYNSLTIGELSLEDMSAVVTRNSEKGDTSLSLNQSNFRIYDIAIDSTSLRNDYILPVEHWDIDLKNITVNTPDSLYMISIDNVEFASRDSSLLIRSVRMDPRLEKGAFWQQVGHEVDRITLLLEELRINGIQASNLNKTGELYANTIQLNRPSLNIYRDNRPPSPPEKRKPLPQQMIRSIPMPVAVDSIGIDNGHIRYNERKPEAEKKGYVDFANLEASIVHLTNIEERWSEENPPMLRARANVMDRALLQVEISFPMTTAEDVQYIEGELQSMNMDPFNVAFEPLAFARIEDGHILGMSFNMRLGERKSSGECILLYENLDIALLDKDANKENLGSQIKSLLANTFVIKSNNKGEDIRNGEISFERDETKSVFNYWWKSLLSGIKSSIGS